MSEEGDTGPPGTGKIGIIAAPADAGDMDKVAHSVLDDLLYNIIHELLLETHRNEKMARAATAAIKIEKLAAASADSSIPGSKPDVRIETDAAIYEDGKVILKGNPLKTTKEILCPRCHLPRLLHPTDGKGAQKADPSVIYCKKHPYIEKPGFDIYGQTWLQPGPGRGKKKRDKDAKADANNESPAPAEEKGSSSKDRPPNVLTFPSATCVKCKRCILVTRLNNHMGSCIGNSGRNASRAAAQKISSGGSNAGSQNNDGTPPETGAAAGSRKGTPLPLPTSQGASPKKRSSDEIEDDAAEGDEEDVAQPKKKKLKPTPTAAVVAKKKVTPKPKAAVLKKDVAKVAKGKPGAARIVEQKMDLADEDGDDENNSDEDDTKDKDNDVGSGSGSGSEEESVVNEPVKTPRTRATPKPTAKKTAAAAKTVPKANPKKAKAQAVPPPILPPSPATTRKGANNKASASAAASAKKAKANKKPAPPPSPAPKKAKRRVLRDDPESDSSGNLSSPP
ncbi:hypothetical protein QBC46DRAFT_123295 [Diplogelasinospora grovesii]|uniref:Transcriptional activator n=1 Tax=Diplogelasinospora grovesii TaxID=303347 RepID=A0AAN6S4V4_9PEZI|nr:hypothetical protein QBC46DRAFT_123295 [Diplogelasinospora grovesii]